MQNALLRFLRFDRPGPVHFALAFAVLASTAPAIADEEKGSSGVASWQGLADGGAVVEFPEGQAGWHNFPAIEFSQGEGDAVQRMGGLFFQANRGLHIGARGGFNPGSGNLSAIFALKLDF